MVQKKHEKSVLRTFTLWLVLAQVGYVVYIHQTGQFYKQKEWPFTFLFTFVWRGFDAAQKNFSWPQGRYVYIWDGLALLQALAVGTFLDLVLRARGVLGGE